MFESYKGPETKVDLILLCNVLMYIPDSSETSGHQMSPVAQTRRPSINSWQEMHSSRSSAKYDFTNFSCSNFSSLSFNFSKYFHRQPLHLMTNRSSWLAIFNHVVILPTRAIMVSGDSMRQPSQSISFVLFPLFSSQSCCSYYVIDSSN